MTDEDEVPKYKNDDLFPKWKVKSPNLVKQDEQSPKMESTSKMDNLKEMIRVAN